MGSTAARPPILLDLTRLARRAGRTLTGIDRVEFAYLEHLSQSGPLWGLVRTALGYVLLDRAGCAALAGRIAADDWPAPDALSRLVPGLAPRRARVETALRRVALARCVPPGLARMLRRHLPAGLRYLNTGHANLTPRVVAALRGLRDVRIAVLLHDTIPLDHPHWQRPETVARFQGFFDRAVAQADLLICNSHVTAGDVQRNARGPVPPVCVAHLGVAVPAPAAPPEGPWTGAPYFVCTGTIEPRKNHALLLDLWPDVPGAHLLLCGRRGWRNEAVFARLDARPDRVHELPDLSDAQIAGLLAGAAGVLFPSRAEGYGLPPMEAAALGVPVICADLPVYREVMGDIPVYADPDNAYLWAQRIQQSIEAQAAGQRAATRFSPPTWAAHFKTVLTAL